MTTTPTTNSGRIIGALLLAQMIAGILINFYLTAPLFGSSDFMVNGALYANQIGWATIASLMLAGLSIWV